MIVAQCVCPTPEAVQEWARSFAATLHAGDVLILEGGLGAGKTTFTQGLAQGLGIDAAIISPTFTISRVYPPGRAGVGLMHVDVYRLLESGPEKHDVAEFHDYFGMQLDSLDIEEYAHDSIVVIEWGSGLAELFAHKWYHIVLDIVDFPAESVGSPGTQDEPLSGDPLIAPVQPRSITVTLESDL